MNRRLINLMLILTVTACIAACLLWSMSVILVTPSRTSLRVELRGWFANSTTRYVTFGHTGLTGTPGVDRQLCSAYFLSWLGMSYCHNGYIAAGVANGAKPIENVRFVGVRYWLVFLVLGTSLIVAIGLRLRQRWWNQQVMTGHCRICGYDLRASPDRCPECGTIADCPCHKSSEKQK